ncbi:trypsin 3A1-like [Uranotaenia lowii]|uniref:trypsin 3A1-like n=1 Tax=Uranotaenia lowii TaxID=190385 RepID=UPI00247A28AF|nr:trypsin 3A1-like [Uranotaenia lowii]
MLSTIGLLLVAFAGFSLADVNVSYEGASTEVSPPLTTASQPRIIGGHPVTIGEVPYQVAVLIKYRALLRLTCGGSILSTQIILTAAHCVNNGGQFYIRAGTENSGYGGQLVKVASYQVHPYYDEDVFDYDSAILKLVKSLVFNPSVSPIKLATTESQYTPGILGKISGWGSTEKEGPLSKKLQLVEVPIVEQPTCEVLYEWINPVSKQMFCAGFVGEGGRDSCQGDSGGPFVVAGALVGIVSWGNECADPIFPGVYAKVLPMREWIDGFL